MATFNFLAQDANGSQRNGVLDAVTRAEAARLLRGQGLRVLRLGEGDAPSTPAAGSVSGKGLAAERFQKFLPVMQRDRVAFFRQLAMLIRAGITLTSALRLQASETPKQRLQEAISEIQREVQGGTPFSRAVRNQRLFPPIASGIISTAEESGELADGLDRIAGYLEYWSELKKKLIQSFVYPGIVFLVAIGVTSMLVFNFIPKLERFLAHSGKSLPAITQFIFDLSKTARWMWPYLLLALFAAGAAAVLTFRNPQGRRLMERALCNLPVLGGVVVAAGMAQFSGIIAVMLRSGLGLVSALALVKEMTALALYRDAFEHAGRSLVAGLPFREAMSGPMVPQSVISVVAAGEEAGTLVQSFEELERFFTKRLEAQVAVLVALVEPALILFVGGIVAFVYFALFAALIRMV